MALEAAPDEVILSADTTVAVGRVSLASLAMRVRRRSFCGRCRGGATMC